MQRNEIKYEIQKYGIKNNLRNIKGLYNQGLMQEFYSAADNIKDLYSK